MKNITFFLVGLALVIIGVSSYFYFHKTDTDHIEEIHFHAGFQVYIDDIKEDFSNFKYMKIQPCGDAHEESDQLEKAHLHDGVGDVVHAHREGGTWGDLFQNINYPISNDIIGYVNGQLSPQILTMPIVPNSSVVFFVGKNSDVEKKVEGRVTQDHIKQVEGKSENCGTK